MKRRRLVVDSWAAFTSRDRKNEIDVQQIDLVWNYSVIP
jgi:hypothetical protein